MEGNTAQRQEPEYPPAIDLREVGEIEGVVVGFDQAPTKFAANAVIVTLKDSGTGELGSLWLSATVLQSQFARLKPKVGETVRVEYLGLREGASSSYHNYKVTIPSRPPFVPDWNALGGEGGDDDVAGYYREPPEGT